MTEAEQKVHLEVRVTVSPSQIDSVTDFIINNLTNGLILEDEEGETSTTIVFYITERSSDELQELTDYLKDLPTDIDGNTPRLKKKLVQDIAWMEEYRKSIKPITINNEVEIRPPWVVSSGLTYDIVIEPQMTFGTGTHETTHGCLKAILTSFQPGMRFLDVGCGSGILSVLVDKVGASFIKGIDYNDEAVNNCRENFQLNEVVAPHVIEFGTIEVCKGDEPYQFVCANIIRSTILEILDQLIALTTPAGTLVLSGLLSDDEEAISTALRERAQNDFLVSHDEEWLTYTVSRS